MQTANRGPQAGPRVVEPCGAPWAQRLRAVHGARRRHELHRVVDLWATKAHSAPRTPAQALLGNCVPLEQGMQLGDAPNPAAVLLDAAANGQVPQTVTLRQLVNRKVKSATTLAELLAVVRAEVGTFDCANTTHALGRLAKMYNSYIGHLRRAGMLTDSAMAAVRERVVGPTLGLLGPRLASQLEDSEPRDTAYALWAYGALGAYDKPLFDALCSRGAGQAAGFRPVDCANVMSAFGRFGHYHPEVLKSIPQVMLYHMYDAKPSELAAVLWGYARLRVPGAPGKVFLEAVCDTLAHSLPGYGPRELSIVMWSLARLQHHPGRMLLQRTEALTLRRLGPAPGADGPQPLQPGAQAAAAGEDEEVHSQHDAVGAHEAALNGEHLNGHANGHDVGQAHHAPDLLTSFPPAASALPPLRRMSPQDMGNLLWAYGRLRYKAAPLLDALPLHLGSWLHAWNTTDLCCLLVGYTHARHYHRGVLDAVAPLLQPRLPELGLSELVTALWAYGIFQHHPTATAPGFLDALTAALEGQLRHARPQTYALIAKACANLRVAPEGLLAEVAVGATNRVHEMRPDEMAGLLYGLSHVAARGARQSSNGSSSNGKGAGPSGSKAMAGAVSAEAPAGGSGVLAPAAQQLFQVVVRQCIRILEEPGHPYADAPHMHYKVLNSIVFSCLRVGYTPWTLIDFAESRGVRIIQPHAAMSQLSAQLVQARQERDMTAGSPPPARVSHPVQPDRCLLPGTPLPGADRLHRARTRRRLMQQSHTPDEGINGDMVAALANGVPQRRLLWREQVDGGAVNGAGLHGHAGGLVRPPPPENEELELPGVVRLDGGDRGGDDDDEGWCTEVGGVAEGGALKGVSFGRTAPPMLHVAGPGPVA